MISGVDTLYVLAEPFHHARTFMAQHHRAVCIVPVIDKAYIGMADARGDDTHQDFIVPRTFHLDGFDPQGPALLAQNSRLNLIHFHT